MQRVCRSTYWVFLDIINKSDKWLSALGKIISEENKGTYFCTNLKVPYFHGQEVFNVKYCRDLQ